MLIWFIACIYGTLFISAFSIEFVRRKQKRDQVRRRALQEEWYVHHIYGEIEWTIISNDPIDQATMDVIDRATMIALISRELLGSSTKPSLTKVNWQKEGF